MDPVQALTRLGGISRRKPLVLLAGRRELEAAIRDGRVVRVGHDRYTLPHADGARVAAASVGGAVSHLSGAMAWGWKVKTPPAQPHVIVPRNCRHSQVEGVVLHYAVLDPAAVVAGRTSALRTALDCARTLPFDEALAVLDSALRSGGLTTPMLLHAVQQGPRTGRSRATRVIEAASAKAANPFESVLRVLALEVPGFTPVPQGEVPGIGHADVADLGLRIALEAESWEHHGLREAFEYDIRRYTAMVRCGWLVVRFTWDDVMQKPGYVRETIRDLVALRVRQQEVGLLAS